MVSAGQPRPAAEALARRAAELGIALWRPGRDYVYESRDVGPFCYAGPRGFRVSLDGREEVVSKSEDDAGSRHREDVEAGERRQRLTSLDATEVALEPPEDAEAGGCYAPSERGVSHSDTRSALPIVLRYREV